MTGTLLRPRSLGRRDLLRSIAAAAALGAAGSAPSRTWAAGTPWADAPASKVDKLNFVVWTYGDIYTKIAGASGGSSTKKTPVGPGGGTTGT